MLFLVPINRCLLRARRQAALPRPAAAREPAAEGMKGPTLSREGTGAEGGISAGEAIKLVRPVGCVHIKKESPIQSIRTVWRDV